MKYRTDGLIFMLTYYKIYLDVCFSIDTLDDMYGMPEHVLYAEEAQTSKPQMLLALQSDLTACYLGRSILKLCFLAVHLLELLDLQQ